MADWTNLPNQAVGVGGLPSGTTVTALRDNPVAIAEGAAGAPRVEGVALGGLFLAANELPGNGTILTITDLDDVSELIVLGSAGGFASGGGNQAGIVEYRLSENNGGSWGGYINIVTSVGDTTVPMWRSRLIKISMLPSFNAVQFRSAGFNTSTPGSVDVFISGGKP